jgi:hypothetical protein
VLQDKPRFRPALMSLARRIGKFISKHSPTLIAIASLAIATFSLHLTIQSQIEDRAYRELLIQPSLEVYTNSADFSIVFVNYGLGPAKVKDMTYRIGSDCLSLGNSYSDNVSMLTVNRIEKDLHARLLRDVVALATSDTHLVVELLVLVPGTVIPVGKEKTFVKVSQESQEVLSEKINEWGPGLAKSLREKFLENSIKIPLAISYCSMSGRYCTKRDRNGTNCPLAD